jgi:hypothetical protein
MVLWFYAGSIECKETFYQELIFFEAYYIYYNLFTAGVEIKS